jgi:hypothetical protein
VPDERRLERVQAAAVREALDGGDLGAVVRDREGQAGVGAAAVDQHRAGTALAVVTPLLGAGEAQLLTEQVQHRHPVVDHDRVRLPVDDYRDARYLCVLHDESRVPRPTRAMPP